MFVSYQKYSGTSYTTPAALLTMAFVASPAALFVSRSTGFVSLLTAIAFSIVCIGMAWNQWKRHSELTVPSLVAQPVRTQ